MVFLWIIAEMWLPWLVKGKLCVNNMYTLCIDFTCC